MKILILIAYFISSLCFAKAPLKVMNFNTMCFFCSKKSDYGTYAQRMKGIADTINRHDPDLISLQEFVLEVEVKNFVKKLNRKYTVVYRKRFGSTFVDPVLLVDEKRFEVRNKNSFWLGPNPKLPFGWKRAFPRSLQWVELFDREREEQFIFVGTHFDNGFVNKTKSALVVNEYLQRFNVPILFAGDTNIEPEMEAYRSLMQNLFDNTFPGVENVKFFSNAEFKSNEACAGSKPDQVFPNCRIDHVLTSKNSPWRVKSWGIDFYRYHGARGFASDHRAVIVDFTSRTDPN